MSLKPAAILAGMRSGLSIGIGLCRGGVERHRAKARLSTLVHRFQWRRRIARIRRREPQRRIIVISLLEHLGDVVAAEPIARYVRRQNPDACIVWAVRSSLRELIDTHPEIDATLPVHCLAEWIYLRDAGIFDNVIDLQVSGRDCLACDLRLWKSDDATGITTKNYYNHGCLLEIFCRCGGLPPLSDAPRVYIRGAARERVDSLKLPRRFVAIHCTSNQDVRDWTAGRWQELTERIADELGLRIVEVGLRPVVRSGTKGYVDLCGKLSILETAEVIRRAEAFVGIDSGPAHLANAVGTYGIILLGQYRSYERYMPYSGDYGSAANADVIQHDAPASAIPVERVLASVAKRVERAPMAASAS